MSLGAIEMKEKHITRQTYYYDHDGEKETMEQLMDSFSSGVIEQQYEQNFLQEHLRLRRDS
ncbi:hypothetical protein [Metabacillus fastidiosus]|uniref:hypothetical protein n=1 Tax=Metabacillus fastidiosus TaxID=1458 RepID=UPI003D2C7B07